MMLNWLTKGGSGAQPLVAEAAAEEEEEEV
jgi:hypothetical protein